MIKTSTLLHTLLLTAFLFAFTFGAQAQKPAAKSQKVPVVIEQPQESFELKIPPLDTLIALALRTSPTLKMQESLMRKNTYLIRSEKSKWTDALATDITAGFGNQSLLVQQPTGDITNFNNFNNGYRVGATLRISMYDLFGRRNEVEMAVSEYEESRHKKDMLAREIISEITSMYYMLIASKNILQIKSDTKHATALNRNMAEKEFNEANIHVAELSRIIEISSKAATEYEVAKQELYKNIRIMENMVGAKLF